MRFGIDVDRRDDRTTVIVRGELDMESVAAAETGLREAIAGRVRSVTVNAADGDVCIGITAQLVGGTKTWCVEASTS